MAVLNFYLLIYIIYLFFLHVYVKFMWKETLACARIAEMFRTQRLELNFPELIPDFTS